MMFGAIRGTVCPFRAGGRGGGVGPRALPSANVGAALWAKEFWDSTDLAPPKTIVPVQKTAGEGLLL
jgi:hypothetical protein